MNYQDKGGFTVPELRVMHKRKCTCGGYGPTRWTKDLQFLFLHFPRCPFREYVEAVVKYNDRYKPTESVHRWKFEKAVSEGS